MVSSIVASLGLLDGHQTLGDLVNGATSEAGQDLRNEGCGGSGELVQELVEVAVVVDAREVDHIVVAEVDDIGPDSGVVELHEKLSDGLGAVDGSIEGGVAEALSGSAELESVGESTEDFELVRACDPLQPTADGGGSSGGLNDNVGSLQGADLQMMSESVASVDLGLVGHGQCHVVVHLLVVVTGISGTDCAHSDQNERLLHLSLIIYYFFLIEILCQPLQLYNNCYPFPSVTNERE